MAQPKNILREAVADAKAIKAAALKNAESLVLEHLKENVKSLVENVLNEEEEKAESAEDEKEEEVCESAGDGNYDDYRMNEIHEGENDGMDKEHEKAHEDLEGGLDLAELGADEDEAADEGEDEGLSETDLEEALAEALNLDRVHVPDLGEDEWIRDTKHPAGINDQDKKEEGWEKKEPTAKLDLSLKEHQAKIAKLVKENVVLKKANDVLKSALEETKLFNHKLLYAHKLMQREGLSGDMKKKIISRMDGAKSINEVKNLFESLDMALSAVMAESTKAQKTEKRSSLAEALGSGGGTQSGKGVSVINEQSDLARRWKTVSGITKE